MKEEKKYSNLQLSNVKCQMSIVRCQLSNVDMSNVNCQLSIVKWQMTNVKSQLQNVNCQLSNVNIQIYNCQCQMSEVSCQMSIVNVSNAKCQFVYTECGGNNKYRKYVSNSQYVNCHYVIVSILDTKTVVQPKMFCIFWAGFLLYQLQSSEWWTEWVFFLRKWCFEVIA